ncbi:MAG: MBOAT family O-acyltransferase [Acutalibacteraceae bacterium]
MLFSSLTFLFAFLPVTLALYFLPLSRKNRELEQKKRNLVLCLASLVFYAWGEPVYIVLMLVSIYFNYNIGLDLQKNEERTGRKKAVLFFGVLFNLFVLGFFKYSGFAVETLNSLFSLNIKMNALPLPVGISFYTFQAMSYIIDVYRCDVKAQRKLLPFALYITMFPQLIAGPIVQYSDIEKQLVCRTVSPEKFSVGILYFIRGLGKKVVFANYIGAVFTEISGKDIASLSAVTAWFGIICFTMQIYFDFSGYSDMAIGLGKMFGFDLVQNFNLPYQSKSITEFWRRWHISLGAWFRDYVYIPLGGNRKGSFRTILNTAVVWCLTGLWHGASWNFVIWGAFYGVLIILEKFVFKNVLDKLPNFLRHILTMLFVIVGWVFFSSETLTQAVSYLGAMFANAEFFNQNSLYYISSYALPLVFMSLSAFGVFKNMPKPKNQGLRLFLQSSLYMVIFIICIVCLVSDTYNPFLYFRF